MRRESEILMVLHMETRVLRSTPLAEVLDLAPGATSKAKKKLLVLGQLGLVGEWREKFDDDFYIWLGTRLGEASRWSKTT